jgi:hypothetical protein
MEQRVNRLTKAQGLQAKSEVITPYVMEKLNRSKYWARRSIVQLAYNTEYLVAAYVQQPPWKGNPFPENHVVNCMLWTCTCGRFQDMLLPCSHAITAITAAKADLMD